MIIKSVWGSVVALSMSAALCGTAMAQYAQYQQYPSQQQQYPAAPQYQGYPNVQL